MIPSFRSRIGKGWRPAAIALLLLAVAELAGIRSWTDELGGMRRPDKNDEFFRYAAQELAEPALCRKIPWAVVSPGGWFFSPSYERSECYDTIAGKTKNPWLCLRVKRLGALSLINDQTSMWSCLNHASHGFQSGMAISQGDLAGFFTQMGYDPDTLHLEGITPPIVRVKDLYRGLTNRYGLAIRSKSAGGSQVVIEPGSVDQADLVKRIENAIDGSGKPPTTLLTGGKDDVENAAYLADMAALVSKDSKWCMHIPAKLALASERAGFRDWCLFTLAVETKDSQLCGSIPVAADGSDTQLSLQAECKRQVNSTIPTMIHYQPEVPSEDERTRVLLTLLHVEIPRARDLPLERIEEAYGQFLEELSHRTDSRHAAARQRFIERVERLRESN
jgi:hypothetical protein